MKRRHLLFAVLSCLLCVAATALWVRSHWRQDGYVPAHGPYVFSTSPGRVWVWHTNQPFLMRVGYTTAEPVEPLGELTFFLTSAPTQYGEGDTYGLCGFAYSSYTETQAHFANYRLRMFGVPVWFIALLAASPALLWLRRRVKRKPPGCCSACGYDLRASPERCPECGAIPQRAHAATSTAAIEQFRR